MNEPCLRLEWDSSFFGLAIARALPPSPDETALRDMGAWAVRERIDCLYCLVDAADAATVRNVENHGFHLADMRMTLENTLAPGSLDADALTGGVRPHRAADLPQLKKLAREHHAQSRFFRDPRFPREKAEELYARWLDKTLAAPVSAIFVTEIDGLIAGYLACEMEPDGTGRISLAGVDPRHRGRGAGTRLVRAALRWFGDQGAELCAVVTQGANIPALRLYASNGFYPVRTELWYHKWFSRESPAP